MENNIQHFKGANWVTLSGSFTPDELREIAKETESKFKEFKELQDGNTK